MHSHPVNIAILASGSGSNAQKIMEYFSNRSDIKIRLLLSNNPEAYALERAKNMGVDTHVFDRKSFRNSDDVLNVLNDYSIDWLILAGFLWLIPDNLLKNFPCRIINIHPALLPNYGGKGMYGNKVHEAVIAAGDKESGISIHFINEHYDEGELIFQAKCLINEGDTADMLAKKIHELEHTHFPQIIDKVIKESKS
jgi:phosphoribosylglycinamide formyltransferase-1